jgi:hypothetical protein
LAATSESYKQSDTRLADINANLIDMVGSTTCPGEPKAGEPSGAATSGVALVCADKEQVSQELRRDAKRLEAIAHDLDEIYADLAGKFPGLDVRKLQDADQREKEFAPAAFLNNDPGEGPQFSYTFANGATQSCVEFTRDLNPNAAIYRDKVSAEPQRPGNNEENPDPTQPPTNRSAPEPPAAAKWSLSVDGRRLCFDNLGAGLTYHVVLKKGLPSKLGAVLAQDFERSDLDVPNYPEQIRFAGGRFILPRSGGGTIDVHATNLEGFDLELYRISDRTLYRQIALGFIGGAKEGSDVLPENEYANLKERLGELLWGGRLTMPKRWKPNEAIGAQIRARDLLNQRTEWLKSQRDGASRAAGGRLDSGIRPLSAATEDEAGLSGRFFADSSAFEAATRDVDSPGVYALVAQPVDQSLCAQKTQDEAEGRQPADNAARACDRPVQWFVTTDIGITLYEGIDNFDVVLRSLGSGEAVRGKVQLVTAGNRVLGESETNAFGVATFPRSLTRGTQSNALAAVMAQTAGDFGFLIFGAERLDLSKLNVDGRTLPLGLDAFLTTDRGIYEPGQPIELLALLRDREGRAIDGPIQATVRLEARGRVLATGRPKPDDWKLGGLHTSLTAPKDARPGPARIVLSLGDNEASDIGETTVHIGPIVPDRVEVQFPDADAKWSARASDGKLEINGAVAARYLFAADLGSLKKFGPARDLHVEAVARISAGETPRNACYDGYAFGRFDEKPIPTTSQTYRTLTNPEGNATIRLGDIDLPVITKPAAATVEVTVYDESGPLGAKNLALAIEDGKGWIGVAKAPRLRQDPATGKSSLDLEVVRLAPDYTRDADSTLEISLVRQRDSYTGVMQGKGELRFTRTTTPDEKPAYSRTLSTTELERPPGGSGQSCVPPERFANLFTDIDVGRYVLTVQDTRTRRLTSLRVQVGAAQTDPDQLEPNIFVLSSDKEAYQPGERVVFTAQTQFDGPVLLALAQGNVERWIEGRSTDHVAKIEFTAPPEWAGKGVYALATVFRAGGKEARRVGPDREIGAKFFQITGAPRGFVAQVAVLWPEKLRPYLTPSDALKFRVCVTASAGDDCNSPVAPANGDGDDVYAMAFVVDEGLLGLTGDNGFRSDPQARFFGRRRLDVRIMDTYSRLLPATGGDRPGRLALSNYTSDRVVAFAIGPKKLEGGRGEFTIDRPGLPSGKLSIRVIVWSKDYVTSQSAEAASLSRVVVDLGAPKFLLAGDRALVPLRVVNVNFAHSGDFAIRASASGAPARVGFMSGGDQGAAEIRFPLDTGASRTTLLAIEPDAASRGQLTVSIDVDPTGSTNPLPGNHRDWSIDVGAPALSSVQTLSFPLQSVNTSISALVSNYVAQNYDPGTVRITARFADSALSLMNSASSFAAPADLGLVLDRVAARALAFFSNRAQAQDPASRAEGERLLGGILSLQLQNFPNSNLQNGSFLPYRTLDNPTLHEFSVDSIDSKDKAQNAGALAGLERIAMVLDVFSAAESAGYSIPQATMADARGFARRTIASRPELGCSFEALHATLALVDSGDADDVQVDNVLACPNKNEDVPTQLSIEQKAALLAIATRFGGSDSVKASLASYERDADEPALKKIGGTESGQLRLAMIANLLARAGAEPSDQEKVATALLDAGRGRISPAAAAWFARDPNATRSTLELVNLRVDGDGLGSIRSAAGGVLESDTVSFERLTRSPTAVSLLDGAKGRGFVSIEGVLSNQKAGYALPKGAIRRRIFDITDAKASKELEPKNNVLDVKIGDSLAIVLEGDKNLLAKVYGGDDSSEPNTGEPIILADLLPSALRVTLGTALCRADVSLPLTLKKLERIGDLRAVDSNLDRWVALVVPDSRHEQPTPDQAPQEGGNEPPPPAQPLKTKPAADCAGPPTASDVDFRQAYVARVNVAGRFLWPGVSLEASTRLSDTYRGDSLTLNVAAPDLPLK